MLEKRLSGTVGWNIWHIDDGHGWHTENVPSLFDKNYEAKPAYYAIQEALEEAAPGTIDPSEKYSNSFQLYENYPNPFNSSTTIDYILPKETRVIFKIYNVFGKEVKTLVNGNQTAGYQSVKWDGKDYLGERVSSGTYIYRVQVDDKIQTKKMLYLK